MTFFLALAALPLADLPRRCSLLPRCLSRCCRSRFLGEKRRRHAAKRGGRRIRRGDHSCSGPWADAQFTTGASRGSVAVVLPVWLSALTYALNQLIDAPNWGCIASLGPVGLYSGGLLRRCRSLCFLLAGMAGFVTPTVTPVDWCSAARLGLAAGR